MNKVDKLKLSINWQLSAMPGILFQSTNERSDLRGIATAHNIQIHKYTITQLHNKTNSKIIFGFGLSRLYIKDKHETDGLDFPSICLSVRISVTMNPP